VFKIQILLPLNDNKGAPFPPEKIAATQEQLVRKFGGYTAFKRSPAQGMWMYGGERYSDDIVVVEILTADLDREWWRAFRSHLEKDLEQEHVMIYAQSIEGL